MCLETFPIALPCFCKTSPCGRAICVVQVGAFCKVRICSAQLGRRRKYNVFFLCAQLRVPGRLSYVAARQTAAHTRKCAPRRLHISSGRLLCVCPALRLFTSSSIPATAQCMRLCNGALVPSHLLLHTEHVHRRKPRSVPCLVDTASK